MFFVKSRNSAFGRPTGYISGMWPCKKFIEIFENFFLTSGKFPYFCLTEYEFCEALWRHFCGELAHLAFSPFGAIWVSKII